MHQGHLLLTPELSLLNLEPEDTLTTASVNILAFSLLAFSSILPLVFSLFMIITINYICPSMSTYITNIPGQPSQILCVGNEIFNYIN